MDRNTLDQLNNTLINPNGPDSKISAANHRKVNNALAEYADYAASTVKNGLLLGIKGVATQANAPTPYDPVIYPEGLFERWVVTSPITSPNSWDNLTVLDEDLINNYVYFNVTNGVPSKELSPKPTVDITGLENAIFIIEDNLEYDPANAGDATGVALTAINDTPIGMSGKLSKLKGNFPVTGNLVFFIAENKTLLTGNKYLFNIISAYSVPVNSVGDNTINISALNIKVYPGQYIGVSSESTAKPFYGVNPSFGVSWYQAGEAPVADGGTHAFTQVPDASFSIGFEVNEDRFTEKDDFLYLRNALIKTEKAYDLPILSGGSANVLLGNLAPAPNSGRISKINFKANIVGVAVFQIFKRLSFGSTPASGGDSFRAKATFQVTAEKTGFNEINLTDLIQIEKGDLIAMVGGAGNVFPSFNADAGVSQLGWFQGGPGAVTEGVDSWLTLQNGSVLFEYWVESNLFEVKSPDNNINKITAVKNPQNYNSIRDLVKGITDASEDNQYEVYVPPGVWNEYDLKGKKWVKVIGDLSGKTVLNLDPTGTMSSNIAPADSAYASEAGKTLGSINPIYLHVLYVTDDSHYENLTFKAKNAKYAAHIDSGGYKKAYFKNCTFIEDSCSFAIGMGINGGQTVTFDQCIIKSLNNGKRGFFYHNWNNQAESNTVTFNRCKFDNCSYGNVDELGSDKNDFLNIFDCFTTLGVDGQVINFMVDITANGSTYWVNPATGTEEVNPVNVPYCIILNTTGTPVSSLTSSDSGTFNPAWAGTPQRDIDTIKNISIINI